MVATTKPPDADGIPPETPILRFDRVERMAHWVNAALFGIVMLTGSILYIGQLSILVGNREIVRFIHVYCGLAIPVAFLVAYVTALGRACSGGTSAASTAGARTTSAGSARWAATRTCGSASSTPGQKLNAAFVVGAARRHGRRPGRS